MRLLHTAVAVIGIAAAGGAAWWYQHRGAPSGPPVASSGASAPARSAAGGVAPAATSGTALVEVGKVERMRIADEVLAVGSLRARQSVVLRPEVSGRVAKIDFQDGQRVRRGQVLFQLEDTLQRAQLQQARAQSSIARTNLQRNRELLAQNFVSASAVDQSAAALEVAEAQEALAQAQLARMRIEAPFDGVAGIRGVNLGDYVKDGADLVSLEDTSAVWVDYRLPERYVGQLRPRLAVEVQLDAMPGQAFTGQIEAVDAVLDANGRSLLVRARLPNPDRVLRSGMFARTRTVFAVRENALVVPEEALVPLGGKQYLFRVVDGASGKVSRRLEAKIGARVPGKAEILEGLEPGDLVVTAGQARLLREDGLPVRVVDINAPAPRRPGSAPAGGVARNGQNV